MYVRATPHLVRLSSTLHDNTRLPSHSFIYVAHPGCRITAPLKLPLVCGEHNSRLWLHFAHSILSPVHTLPTFNPACNPLLSLGRLSRIPSSPLAMSKAEKNTDKLAALQSSHAQADDLSGIYRHHLRASHALSNEGETARKKAEKAVKKLFGGETKYMEAADYYEQAGKAYKMNENWEEAAAALIKAAEIQESKLKNTVEASAMYTAAARAYREVDVHKAVDTFKMSVALHMEAGRHASAARVYEEISDIQAQEGLNDDSLDSLEQAATCFESDNMDANAVQCYVKIAALAMERGEYAKAGDLYEKAAKVCVGKGINKGSIHEYYFSALICYMVVSANNYNTDLPRSKLADYVRENRKHEGTREFKMIVGCLKAFDDEDSKAFTKVIFEYNKMTPIDEVTSRALLKVKQVLKAGPPAHVTGGAEDAAGDDDYT